MNLFLIVILSLALIKAEGAAPSPFEKNAALFHSKCSKCHTIGRGDRVGPDLKGLGARREKAWIIGMITKTDWYLDNDPEAKKLLEKFNGARMENPGLSPAQAEGLLSYIEEASKGPQAPDEELELEADEPSSRVRLPDEGRGAWLPGIAAALFALALAALSWQFQMRVAAGMMAALALGASYWSLGGRRHHRLLGDNQGYAPPQPIEYSHRSHAGKLKIDCMYCHYGARRSDSAGVPPAQICMNCHKAVRKTAGSAEPNAEIAKLVALWDTRLSSAPRTIQWNRVHDLPDYVHFPHRVHVADGIRCQECHGPVQEMARLRQTSSMSMGWCIDCHRLEKSKAPSHWKRAGGPLDCAACHW